MKRLEQQFYNLKSALEQKPMAESKTILASLEKMEDADVAAFLADNENLTVKMVPFLNQMRRLGDVLVELPEDKLEWVLDHIDSSQMKTLFNVSTVDDLIYIIDFMRPEVKSVAIANSSKKHQIEKFLQYEEDQVGRIMQTPVFALPSSMTVLESIEKLRQRSLEEFIFYIYCIDESQKLIGVVSMREVATAPADQTLGQLMKKNVISVRSVLSTKEVAKIAAHYNFVALPVIDEMGVLLGLVTIDDIVDIIQDQNTTNIYATAGLHPEEKIHTPILVSFKHRIPWMGLNLLLAIFASFVISLFEQTMSRLIILASLKNIVASMGGNTAIQTLTVTTRGIATGDFRFTPFIQALFKELVVGLLMGVFMGIGAGAITYFWKGDLMVSLVIFIAMILNFIVAVVMGSVIPIILSKFKKDPAVGSGVLVTMITDIFGFFTFLGIAKIGLYLYGLHL